MRFADGFIVRKEECSLYDLIKKDYSWGNYAQIDYSWQNGDLLNLMHQTYLLI